MGRLALIGGRGFEDLGPWDGEHEVLDRHGSEAYTPAHLVDHAASIEALRAAGCDRVLAICSVGSLHAELEVGAFLCPGDFISFGQVQAAFDDERGHVVPGFDLRWRRLLLEAWAAAGAPSIRDGGVYWQSPGPRFETPAEVRLIAAHADVVGMTMASECVAANQLGLAYAAVCIVDNLANGVAAEPLSPALYEAGVTANRERLGAALAAVLPTLSAEAA